MMTTYEEFNLLEIRARLGLSRDALAKMLGWTVSRVWAIEKRGDALTEHEYAHASGVLAERIGDQAEVEADQLKSRDRVLRDTPPGCVRLIEWEGFNHGDTVRVRGAEGTWVFQYHHTNPNGSTYVTVYGGTKGHGSTRSFAPDRILPARRRR